MDMSYVQRACKGAAIGLGIGAALGVYANYNDRQRRTTRSLGLPELVYLEQHDTVVYALAQVMHALERRSIDVDIRPLAIALDNLAQLTVRIETESYKGALKFQAARKSGEIMERLGVILAESAHAVDEAFKEHLETIRAYAEDTRHNLAID
jgi:hypothetical protein